MGSGRFTDSRGRRRTRPAGRHAGRGRYRRQHGRGPRDRTAAGRSRRLHRHFGHSLRPERAAGSRPDRSHSGLRRRQRSVSAAGLHTQCHARHRGHRPTTLRGPLRTRRSGPRRPLGVRWPGTRALSRGGTHPEPSRCDRDPAGYPVRREPRAPGSGRLRGGGVQPAGRTRRPRGRRRSHSDRPAGPVWAAEPAPRPIARYWLRWPAGPSPSRTTTRSSRPEQRCKLPSSPPDRIPQKSLRLGICEKARPLPREPARSRRRMSGVDLWRPGAKSRRPGSSRQPQRCNRQVPEEAR